MSTLPSEQISPFSTSSKPDKLPRLSEQENLEEVKNLLIHLYERSGVLGRGIIFMVMAGLVVYFAEGVPVPTAGYSRILPVTIFAPTSEDFSLNLDRRPEAVLPMPASLDSSSGQPPEVQVLETLEVPELAAVIKDGSLSVLRVGQRIFVDSGNETSKEVLIFKIVANKIKNSEGSEELQIKLINTISPVDAENAAKGLAVEITLYQPTDIVGGDFTAPNN